MIDVRLDVNSHAVVAAVSSGTPAAHLGPLLHRVASTARDAGAGLVLDVSDVMLNDLAAVQEFVGALLDRGRHDPIRVVARRGTARALLRRLGGGAISVHPNVDLALADARARSRSAPEARALPS